MLSIWPDLFDYNINVYIVCKSGSVSGGWKGKPDYSSALTHSGSMSASYNINETTGVITITNTGFLKDAAELRVSGALKISGAVVILSKKPKN